jgi:transmembrane protein TMEM260 (protein O-mannosyltransferase)
MTGVASAAEPDVALDRPATLTDADRAVLAGFGAAVVLLALYAVTLAPDVTLWDAGEFAAAAHALGIPHPPGTPLYVLIAAAWTRALDGVLPVLATNALSAAATAAACGIFGWLVGRWTTRPAWGFGAGLVAGTMASVWLNANETEVYALSLLLSAMMLAVAEHARYDDGRRWAVGLAYLFALAVPLHLSALVAAPAAAVLASLPPSPAPLRLPRLVMLGGAIVIAAGAGTVAPRIALVGLTVVVAGIVVTPGGSRGAATRQMVGMLFAIALALSCLAFLLLRARHDPSINQGNPATLAALREVVARAQYDVAPIWPRRAPLWLQVGNLVQYADWQIGLGLSRAVGAAWLRTPFTVLFIALAAHGSVLHARRDRRTWIAALVLLGGATLGVVLYLNLLAGPSYGYGVLPDDATHEARERDYFFALGFAAWGLWAGLGLVEGVGTLLGRWRAFAPAAALLPAAVNLVGVDRRREPEGALARAFATAVLDAAPPRAVLFVEGDNDTYPLWYVQEWLGIRRDVTTITIPLLGADWYRAELARRHRLGRVPKPGARFDENATLAELAESAEAEGRPVAATVAVLSGERLVIRDEGRWRLEGMVYVHDPDGSPGEATISSRAAARAGRLIERLIPDGLRASELPDPSSRYVGLLLTCPRLAQRTADDGDQASAALLDSRCNLR